MRYAVMPRMCERIPAALQDGGTVIADHMISVPGIRRAFCDAASGFQTKTVPVSCNVEPCAGSAEASFRSPYPQTGYDLHADSSEAGPVTLADVIFGALS